jgi:hypothetical protein
MLPAPHEAQDLIAGADLGQLAGQRRAHFKLLLGATAPPFDQPTLAVR